MIRCLTWVMLVLASLHLGFWWDADKQTSDEKTESKQETTREKTWWSQWESFFQPKEDTTKETQAPETKRVPRVAPEKPAYVPPPTGRPESVSPNIVQIRAEVQKIIDLNKKIKNIQAGRVQQLQRIQEQARIHQRILNELQSSQKAKSDLKVPDREALLAQEKLRIIHEATRENRKLIQKIETEQEDF